MADTTYDTEAALEKKKKENAEAAEKKAKAEAKAKEKQQKELGKQILNNAKAAKEAAEDAEKKAKDNLKFAKEYLDLTQDNIKEHKENIEKLEKKLVNAQAEYENMAAHPDVFSAEDIQKAKETLETVKSDLENNKTELTNLYDWETQYKENVEKATTDYENAKATTEQAKADYKKVKEDVSNNNLEDAEAEMKSMEDNYNPTVSDAQSDVEATQSALGGSDMADSSNGVNTYDPATDAQVELTDDAIAPWDVRLYRSDLFRFGDETVPFSSEEASGIMADLIEFAEGGKGHKGHAKPADKKQYGILANDPNVYGLLSLVNPYSITRLYGALKVSKPSGHYTYATMNKMLDIRDQKRFYDLNIPNASDYLSVSNPTTSNIIQAMNNDRWGRTPYTYQDFVFCKYWNRIPNNRLITLRKYAAPTYDNLCWEMMGHDKGKLSSSFAPIATACTFFGGESGNNLKDIFKIQSGLNWEKLEADMWTVTGDAGQSQQDVADENLRTGGTNGMGPGWMFNTGGRIAGSVLSARKLMAAMKNPNVFSTSDALASKNYENIHDPNDNGPYANRIKGPVNRISEVMKRKAGLKFEHKISLKFSYKARPIGGVNTKAAMLDILSNMLLLCTASAVFWGGGHRFEVVPRAYPWHCGQNVDGFLKAMYNGQIFGEKGAIAHALKGVTDLGSGGSGSGGSGGGGFSMENVMKTLSSLGSGIMGAFGGAINALVGTLKGAGMNSISEYIAKGEEWIKGAVGKTGNASSYEAGKGAMNNVLKTTQDVWKSNSVKSTILPHIEGMRAILLGTPVGNWHLTVGNPLNPIAVIGNLICQDIQFEFGEELGPDDFPDELECTVTLEHGMPRDLAAIESMFNRGAGRIYQAPDYMKMWGTLPSSEQETRVDNMTGGTSVRVPHAYMAVEGRMPAGKGYVKKEWSTGKTLSNSGSVNQNMVTPLNGYDVIDYNRGGNSNQGYSHKTSQIRAAIAGNMHTRHYVDS